MFKYSYTVYQYLKIDDFTSIFIREQPQRDSNVKNTRNTKYLK